MFCKRHYNLTIILDLPDRMMDPSGSLFVVSHFLQSQFSYLWMRLEKQCVILDVRNPIESSNMGYG